MFITPRRVLFAAAVLLLVCGSYGCVNLGSFLASEDELVKADAIFLFAGSQAERPLAAADLFKAGYAPTIVLTRPTEEPAVELLVKRGIILHTRFSVMREVLDKLGIPDAAVVVPERLHDNTAQEARTLRDLALARGWRRVILVSSNYHLRRVRMASRRALRGTNIEVVLHASRYDPATPGRWWRHRSDLRQILWELPKVIGYAAGVGE
jgi:uncharacterized SAM-binding protein YcdF (DUF218 family)